MLLGLLGDMGGEFRRQQLKSGNMLTAEAHTGTKYFPPHAIFPSFFFGAETTLFAARIRRAPRCRIDYGKSS